MLGRQMGAVAEAEGRLTGVRQEEATLRRDPFMDNATREAKAAELKATREVAKEQLNSARAADGSPGSTSTPLRPRGTWLGRLGPPLPE